SPLSKIAINASGVPPKLLVRLVEPSVVSKVVDPNLKAILRQFLSQLARILVLSFGNKIEGGAKPKVHVELHQIPAPLQTNRSFHIVCEDEREFLAIRPAWPVLRSLLGAWHDRPDTRRTLASTHGDAAPHLH